MNTEDKQSFIAANLSNQNPETYKETNPKGKNKRQIFTTERKHAKTTINISRKGSITKEKCRQLTRLVQHYFSSGIIDDNDLTLMILDNIGGDKETVRAYKGYSGHIRQGRCGDNKIVGLSRKGYLELYGFMRKIPGYKWQVCQQKLLSEDMTSEAQERKIESNKKISISPIITRKESEKTTYGVVSATSREREEEEEDTEKERNFTPKNYRELNADEFKIFDAMPCAEPDRAKTNLREGS
jgi:hypothetical protein